MRSGNGILWKKRSVIDLFVVILDCRFRNRVERLYGIKKECDNEKSYDSGSGSVGCDAECVP
uniref:hypothetical protein n=1 Tax=Candidatus Limisoma sp. TaxID=3076476 RepID=UPI003FF02262